MSLSEECLYIMLESLYRQYFRGQIPKERASVKKQQIINDIRAIDKVRKLYR